MGDDYWDDYDTSWVPIVSGIFGTLILFIFIATLCCYCCGGWAMYKRRREMQVVGVTTVMHTGYGRGGRLGRNQVVIVQQGVRPGQQPYERQQPPPYSANPDYPPGSAPPQNYPNPDYPPGFAPPPTYPHPDYPPGTAPPQAFSNPEYNPAYPSGSMPPQGQSQGYPVQPGPHQGQPFPGQNDSQQFMKSQMNPHRH